MFIQVRLLKGFPQPLLYEVPANLTQKDLTGSIVRVPIQKRIAQALVLRTFNYKPNSNFEIRPIEGIEKLPHDPHYMPFIQHLAQYYQTEPTYYLKRIHQFVAQKPISNTMQPDEQTKQIQSVTLTDEQQTAFDFVQQKITDHVFTPTVIHGVTGSGKTEVYKKLIEHAYAQNKTTLLLLPEVTLALQFERLLKIQFPQEIVLLSFHSASAAKDKKTIWQRLLNRQPTVIIGVHVPVLLPLPNLGLIIVDEEHEVGYQEKKHPKTNTKEAAIMRAKLHNIPIVLGSATPSVSTLYNIKQRGWHFFQLKKRFAGHFPKIKIVTLNDKKQRRNFWISQDLQNSIKDRLHKKEQTILFLNRRGHSFFVQCKSCSFIFECKNCSVSLTLHENNNLHCHYCAYSRALPAECPTCQAPEKDFIKKGVGTQKLVTIVQKLFPYARIARADMDTSTKKKEWKVTMNDFSNGDIDILIGTQTITKGYHFPKVTLVGIIWADLNLHFPRYNATETTLQQLIQVAGRAGRQTDESLVILQAMAEHHAFSYMKEIDYLQFYNEEIETRKEVNYPPCTRLIEIEVRAQSELAVIKDADKIIDQLFITNENDQLDATILGPAKPPVHKIKNCFSRVIYLKTDNMHHAYRLFNALNKKQYKSSIYFTPNPL
ncbi:MAG: primosomal protein N' [Candidatus Dependentiae bacterium]